MRRRSPTLPDHRQRSRRRALARSRWSTLLALSCFALEPGCSHSEPQAQAAPADSTRSPAPAPPQPKVNAAVAAVAAEAKAVAAKTAAVAQAKPEPPPGPRVYAKSRFVWIRQFPTAEVQWIGFLWTGGSVALKSEKIHYGPGCEHWYEVEPQGFVCVDGKRATLNAEDPALDALAPVTANLESAWPHQYGESLGLQRTLKPPAKPAGASTELDPGWVGRDVQRLPEDPFGLVELPRTVHEGRNRLLPLSTVAFSSELEVGGQSYLLAADMTWVPKARVKPYPKVTFRGVELGKDARLPLAFIRTKDRPQYTKAPDGGMVPNGKQFQRLSYMELSGASLEVDGEEFLELKSGGLYIKKSDAVVPTPRAQTPWGTRVGSDDTTGHPKGGRATWLESSVWGGWLIAYEGNRPVFTTLVAPGRGGTPVPGKDPIETASTPTGTFPITGKFATATMEAPGEFIHSDVPWTQNFSGPHALHGAYWHDDWGNLKSGGCVNVSPLDGRWLYAFTEPKVPEGWHGVRWLPKEQPASLFVVHR